MKYLVMKPPRRVALIYDCGGHDPCTCKSIESLFDQSLPLIVTTYYPDLLDSKKNYEALKKDGIILHETEDYETAVKIMEEAMIDAEKVDDDRC